jgi:predicted TIM-barrel fold metal-dependent hydrolase
VSVPVLDRISGRRFFVGQRFFGGGNVVTTAGERRQIIVSTDGHCGADLRDYKPYLEQRYQEQFDAWAAGFHDAWADELDQERDVDNRAGVASAASELNWDSALRSRYLDGQGIAAEVLFPNTPPPFYPSGVLTSPGPRSREEYELRFAGLRAHNRWIADFCAQDPDRRAGFCQIFLEDIPESIAEVTRAKAAGLRGVLLPGDHVLKMANLYYPELDPLWEVCADLDMPVHRHAAAPTESVYEGGKASQLVHFVEVQFYSGRAISHVIFSGAFERYPNLTFVTTEIAGAAEIKENLARMDTMVRMRDMGTGTPFYAHVKDALEELRRMPTEYFASNCYVGGPHDLRHAYDVGVANLMWGADIPHSEGTGPFTIESLRVTLADLPADERSLLLADRAIEVYGFDRDRLQAIADRVGPTVDELATPLPRADWPRYPDETCCSVFRGGHAPEPAGATA